MFLNARSSRLSFVIFEVATSKCFASVGSLNSMFINKCNSSLNCYTGPLCLNFEVDIWYSYRLIMGESLSIGTNAPPRISIAFLQYPGDSFFSPRRGELPSLRQLYLGRHLVLKGTWPFRFDPI